MTQNEKQRIERVCEKWLNEEGIPNGIDEHTSRMRVWQEKSLVKFVLREVKMAEKRRIQGCCFTSTPMACPIHDKGEK